MKADKTKLLRQFLKKMILFLLYKALLVEIKVFYLLNKIYYFFLMCHKRRTMNSSIQLNNK